MARITLHQQASVTDPEIDDLRAVTDGDVNTGNGMDDFFRRLSL